MNIRFLVTLLTVLTMQVAAFAQTYTWTGATSSDWAVSTNWSPNGVPGIGHTVNISNASAPNSCVLDSDRTITALSVTAGTLNLNNRTITTTASSAFTGGIVHNGGISSANITNVNNTTFTGTVSITKTGGTDNNWAGGNSFNNLTVINRDNNRIRLATTNGDIYNGAVTFDNPNNGIIEVAYAGSSTFSQGVTVNNATAGTVSFGASGGTSLIPAGKAILTTGFSSGTLTLNNVSQSGTAANGSFNPANFNATNTILGGSITVNATGNVVISSSNFTAANTIAGLNVVLTNANKLSTTSGVTSITKTGTGTNTWTGGNTFGNLVLTSQAGTIRLASTDGDVFNGSATFNNPSNGTLDIASVGTSTFNQGVTVNNSTAGTISFGASGGETIIPSGKAILTSGFSSGTLTLNNVTQSGTAANGSFNPANFNATNTILGGSITINATNTVIIKTSNFTASNTISGINVTLNSSNLTASNTITGENVSLLNANRLSTVSGTTTITKTSGSADDWTGGNTFGNLIITNQDNNRVRMAVETGDTFNGTVIFNRQSTGIIDVAYIGTSTFNAPVTVNNSSSGSIRFGVGGGHSVFNATATFDNQSTGTIDISYAGATTFNENIILNNSSTGVVRIGFGGTTSIATSKAMLTTGFNSGTLTLNSVIQSGTAPNGSFFPATFTAANAILGGNLTVNATNSITIDASSFTGTNSITGANITLTNANKLSTTSGTTTITKTGGTNNIWTGGNTFGNLAITNQGGSILRLGNVNGDTFSGAATLSNQGTGTIEAAHAGATSFAQGVTVNNATAGTISFGAAGGTSSIPAGRAVLTGGYTGGTLTLNNVTQAGTTANGAFSPANFNAANTTLGGNLTVTATASITLNGTSLTATNTLTGANVTLTNANRLSTVSGTTEITKTGGAHNDWTGGNTFGNLIIINNGGFRIRMADSSGDTFNGPVSFNRNSTGNIHISYSGTSTFNASVTVNNNSAGFTRFGQNGGNSVFNAPAIFNNPSTGSIDISYAGASTFNQNITLNNTSTGIISFGTGAGTTSIAAGRAILTTGFNNGTLTLSNVTQAGTAANGSFSPATFTATTTILGGSIRVNASSAATLNNCHFTASNTITSADITLLNANRLSTVSGTTELTKTGGAANNWTGGNTFGNVTINNQGSNILRLALTNGDTFSGTVTFSNQGTGTIEAAHAGATSFAQGVTVNNATAGTISFGAAGGTSSIPAGRAVLTGGYTGGTLTLNNVTQAGTTANGAFSPANFNAANTTLGGNLTVTATASITLNGASLTATNTLTGANVTLNNTNNLSTTSGSTTITKTGGTTNNWTGGNTFGNLTITNQAAALLRLANEDGDMFNSTVTFNNQNSNAIDVAYKGNSTFAQAVTVNNTSSGTVRFGLSAGNAVFGSGATFNNQSTGTVDISYAGTTIFNENITLNNSSTGITRVGLGGTTTIAAGKAILTTGFSNGTLTLNNITQNGTAANSPFSPATFAAANTKLGGNLTVTATGSITIDASSLTACNTLTGANVTLNNINNLSTISGSTTITKTGGTTNNWTGGNTFGDLVINNQAGALLRIANIGGDMFLGTVTLNNQNTSITDIAYKGNSAFAKAVIVNNASSGTVRFGFGAGDALFSSSATFNNQSTGTVDIAYSGASTFSQGAIVNNASTGTIRFGVSGGTTSIPSGKAILTSGFTNGALVLNGITQAGSAANGPFSPASFTSSNALFGGAINVSTPGALSITAGNFSGVNSLSGATVTIASSAFAANNNITGTTVALNSSTFAANNTISGTSVTLNGSNLTASNSITGQNVYLTNANSLSTAGGTTTITKTGGTTNNWTGGNTFGNVTIQNQGGGILRLANTNGDTFASSATFIQSGSGLLQPAYNGTSTFLGDISTVGTSAPITFGLSSGEVVIGGTDPQKISGAEAYKPIFRRLTMNAASSEGGGLTLQVPVDISVSLTMTNGKINTTATNILLLNDETVNTTVGNSTSYVNGPLQYNLSSNSASRSTLNFPIGQGSDWRPLTLEVAHNTNTPYIYQAEVSNASANDLKWTVPEGISHVSKARYWDINRYLASSMASTPSANLRTSTSDHPKITLYYGANDGVTDPDYLTICKNTPTNPTVWTEIGGMGATASSGSITSASFPNPFDSFSRFTLANLSSGVNPLPIELLSFEAILEQKAVRLLWATASEHNNDYFTIERSKDLASWQEVKKVKGAGNSSVRLDYLETDNTPLSGISYYRLKQTDSDGTYTYSKAKQVTSGETANATLVAYPNPTTGQLYLLGDPAELAHARVYNQLGQDVSASVTITHAPDAPTSVDLTKLSTGLYFVKTKLRVTKVYRL